MKYINVFLASAALVLLAGCSGSEPVEQAFFQYKLTVLKDRVPVRDIALEKRAEESANLAECFIKDSLVFTPSRGEGLFELSKLSSDDDVRLLLRRGRAANELVSAGPLSEVVEVDGDRCAYLYSVSDSKCFLWNIDKTLDTGEDVYDRQIKIDNSLPTVLTSVWWLDDENMIAFNSCQNPYKMSELNAPKYVQYSVDTGKPVREYELFSSADVPKSSVIPVFALLSSVDCIRPDRQKIAFAMSYMPVLSILDLDSGKAKGFVLPDAHHLDYDVQRWHFTDIAANEDCIFALYSGDELYNGLGTDIPGIMYVLDWNGKLIRKYRLGGRFTNIQLDGEMLYFTGPGNTFASIKVPDVL